MLAYFSIQKKKYDHGIKQFAAILWLVLSTMFGNLSLRNVRSERYERSEHSLAGTKTSKACLVPLHGSGDWAWPEERIGVVDKQHAIGQRQRRWDSVE